MTQGVESGLSVYVLVESREHGVCCVYWRSQRAETADARREHEEVTVSKATRKYEALCV